MRTLQLLSVTLSLFIVTENKIYADVFPKSAESFGGLVVSAELLGSYEFVLSARNSISLWGGFATVLSPFGPDINAGPEAAAESRYYFSKKENKSWAISFYLGAAYNFINEKYSAITPGIKLTRKISVNKIIQSEPYISLSYPFYNDSGRPFFPLLTFGYRFVLEKMRYL